MNNSEKAPASVCETLTGAVTGKRGALISCEQSTTAKPKNQGQIAAVLPRGEANAIPAKDLAEMVGAPSVRALQTMIARECAVTSALILSTTRHSGGYFLPAEGPAGREEIQRFVGTLTARARHTFMRLRAARRALRDLDGQLAIEGGTDEWKT